MPLIHYRIVGHIITITLHVSNMIVMMSSFHGDVMKNAFVRHFNEMQFYFFTCWTFTFQTIYAIVALCCDILVLMNSKNQEYELPKSLANSRDAIFTVLVWPATMLVSSVFWSFFHYDRSLLYPTDIDLAISSTSNHIMHSFIVISTLWEMMFRPRTEPKDHTWYKIWVWLIEGIYTATVVAVYLSKGVWVYPIFGILLGSVYFYLFFVWIGVMLGFIYHAQWALNDFLWVPSGGPKSRACAMAQCVQGSLKSLVWGPSVSGKKLSDKNM